MNPVIAVANKLIGEAGGQLVGEVFDGIAKIDKSDVKLELQLKFNMVISALNEKMLDYEAKLADLKAQVLKVEMSGNWLQRSWRPLLMLTFGALLVMRWLGVTAPIPKEIELELMQIIKIGLGGYVIGRSAEKITSNMDLGSVLKKK